MSSTELRAELNRLHSNESCSPQYDIFGSDPFFMCNDTIYDELNSKALLQRLRSHTHNAQQKSKLVNAPKQHPGAPQVARRVAPAAKSISSASMNPSEHRPASWLLKREMDQCDQIVANETRKQQLEARRSNITYDSNKPVVNKQSISRLSTPPASKSLSTCTAVSTAVVPRYSVSVPMDVQINENKSQYSVAMHTPGVNKKQLSMVLWSNKQGPQLSISSTNDTINQSTSTAFSRLQRVCSHITHTFVLPDDCDIHAITAKHENDKLSVTLPKIKKPVLQQSKSITIQ